MALENDFLTFAAASGANVMAQADYAAASATATGYVSGVASSAAVNKTLRQTSIMSAMTAKFIVDYSNQPAIDDGTIQALETNFAAAILHVASGRVIQISDVVNLTPTLAGLLPVNGNAASASRLANARTITVGGIVSGAANFDGSTNVTINVAMGDGALTIAKTNGLQAALNALAPLASPALTGLPTAPTQAVGDNTSNLSTTAFVQAALNAAVQVAMGANGFSASIKGLQIQMGVGTLSPSGGNRTSGTLTFPTPFPNKCYGVFAISSTSNVTSVGWSAIISSVSPSTTGALITADINADLQSHPIIYPVQYTWIAFGN